MWLFEISLKGICTERLHCDAYEEGAKKATVCTHNSQTRWVKPGGSNNQQAEPASETLGTSVLFLREQVAFCLSAISFNDALLSLLWLLNYCSRAGLGCQGQRTEERGTERVSTSDQTLSSLRQRQALIKGQCTRLPATVPPVIDIAKLSNGWASKIIHTSVCWVMIVWIFFSAHLRIAEFLLFSIL